MTTTTITQLLPDGCITRGGTCRTCKPVFGWMCTRCVKATGRVPCRHVAPQTTIPYLMLPTIEEYQVRCGLTLDEAVARVLAAGLQTMETEGVIIPATEYPS